MSQLIHTSGAVWGLVAFAPWVSGCQSENGPENESQGPMDEIFEDLPEGMEPVVENIGTAKKLNYRHTASRSKIRTQAKSHQTCGNCTFFTRVKETPYGRCAMIPTDEGVVVDTGWCTAWKGRRKDTSPVSS